MKRERPVITRATRFASSLLIATACCLALGAQAHAAFTVPAPPIVAGGISVSDISLNGVAGNTIVVAPGADVQITATTTNVDTGCQLCFDYLNTAFKGQPNAGCLSQASQNGDPIGSAVQTHTVDLGAAPATPGTYDVIGDFESQYNCGDAYNANGTATIAQVQVAAPGVPTTPTPPPVVRPANCGGHTVNLLEVYRSGARVVINGSALPSLKGQQVKIAALVGSRRAAPSVLVAVQGDGSFSASVPLPARSKRAKVRYRASIAGRKSNALRLARKITVLSRGDAASAVTVGGKVAGVSRATKITVALLLNCTKTQTVASIKTDAKGRFSVALPRPQAPALVAYYRLSAKLALGSAFSLPIAVARLL
jgi:hypothetical protein